MDDATWYCVKNGARLGPFALPQLQQMAEAGLIDPDDLVRSGDDDDWSPASSVPVLFPPVEPASEPLPAPSAGPLVACEKCQAGISDLAETCPRCGHPQPIARAEERGVELANCGQCRTINLISTIYGVTPRPHFLDEPCRGCGRPNSEVYPRQFLESQINELYGDYLETRLWLYWWIIGAGAATGALVGLVAYKLNSDFDRTVALVIGAAVGAYCSLGTYQYLYRLSLTSTFRFPPPNDSRRITASDWSLAAYRRERFDEGVRRRQSARTAPTPNPWPGWLVWLGIATVVAGVLFYQNYLTDYAVGHRAGVQHVRQVNKEGPFIRAGMNIANALDVIVTDPKQSADWNAGFRAGFKEEIGRMYPELGKK